MLNNENIRKFIQGFGSDAELAHVAGVSRMQVWNIRNGRCLPGRRFIEGVLRAGMRREDLFDA